MIKRYLLQIIHSKMSKMEQEAPLSPDIFGDFEGETGNQEPQNSLKNHLLTKKDLFLAKELLMRYKTPKALYRMMLYVLQENQYSRFLKTKNDLLLEEVGYKE